MKCVVYGIVCYSDVRTEVPYTESYIANTVSLYHNNNNNNEKIYIRDLKKPQMRSWLTHKQIMF